MEKEKELTKLGVEEDEELQKVATEDGRIRCPACGRKVIQHGSISVCPVHGTEPFEKAE